MVEAGLGLGPWEALNQGIARQLGLEIGTVSILLGIPILALWWPLGERPGIGTVLNVVLIGTSTNLALALLPTPAGRRPGRPLRDDARRRRGHRHRQRAVPVDRPRARAARRADDRRPPPLRLVDPAGADRRRADACSCSAGLLGGTVGLGTVVFALGIGPLVQVALGVFDRGGPARAAPPGAARGGGRRRRVTARSAQMTISASTATARNSSDR